MTVIKFETMKHTIGNKTAVKDPTPLFEENYYLLLSLMPEMRRHDAFVLSGKRGQPDLDVAVLEQARYTTTLELNKGFGGGEILRDLCIKIRVYHDACVAEVIGYQGCDRIPPRFMVRGDSRYLKDEKRQVNEFLNQVLQYCVAEDYLATVEPGCTT